jgi:hypothetical protein
MLEHGSDQQHHAHQHNQQGWNPAKYSLYIDGVPPLLVVLVSVVLLIFPGKSPARRDKRVVIVRMGSCKCRLQDTEQRWQQWQPHGNCSHTKQPVGYVTTSKTCHSNTECN